MVQQTLAVGAASIKPYKIAKLQTISAPSSLTTSMVAAITTAPDVDDPSGSPILASTAYNVQIAFLGLSDLGGMAITTLSNVHSINTGVGATGIKVTVTIPAYALGVAVFINGALAHIMPQKPQNRMNATSASREICIYYKATGNAMTAAAAGVYAAAHTCYGMTRSDYPDTTGDTTITFETNKITIAPGHSGDFDVVTGKRPTAKGSFFKYDKDVRAGASGSLRTTEGSEDITIYGYRGSSVPKGSPFELITPSDTAGQQESYFFMSAEMSTEPLSLAYSKAGNPNMSITIKELPDEINVEVPTFFMEPWL